MSNSKLFFSAVVACDLLGNDAENAYALAFHGKIVGGLHDGGRDVEIPDRRVRYVQVKSSVAGMMKAFKQALEFHRFTPVCFGEPGSLEEMIESIVKFGAWIGRDIPKRDELLRGALQVRTLCAAA